MSSCSQFIAITHPTAVPLARADRARKPPTRPALSSGRLNKRRRNKKTTGEHSHWSHDDPACSCFSVPHDYSSICSALLRSHQALLAAILPPSQPRVHRARRVHLRVVRKPIFGSPFNSIPSDPLSRLSCLGIISPASAHDVSRETALGSAAPQIHPSWNDGMTFCDCFTCSLGSTELSTYAFSFSDAAGERRVGTALFFTVYSR